MNGRRKIERRRRIFLGCEGESEQGYGVLLQRLADSAGLKVHIVVKNLQPAGDPLALAEKAVRQFEKDGRKALFIGKAIILDADRLTEPPDRGARSLALLKQEGFTAIWQQPDHEGLLLRHFSGHEYDNPPRGNAMNALRAVWPNYRKNMAAADLQRQITLVHVERAAGVIPELKAFLSQIGLCNH